MSGKLLRSFKALAFALVISGGPVAWGDTAADLSIKRGNEFIAKRAYSNALTSFHEAALGNHPTGMERYAYMLWHGLGTARDRKTAFYWYFRAADHGHAGAMVHVGKALKFGNNIQPDPAAAVRWFRKAADTGDAEGMYRLGIVYQFGEGIARDLRQARVWFNKSAALGHTGASVKLMLMKARKQQ